MATENKFDRLNASHQAAAEILGKSFAAAHVIARERGVGRRAMAPMAAAMAAQLMADVAGRDGAAQTLRSFADTFARGHDLMMVQPDKSEIN